MLWFCLNVNLLIQAASGRRCDSGKNKYDVAHETVRSEGTRWWGWWKVRPPPPFLGSMYRVVRASVNSVLF